MRSWVTFDHARITRVIADFALTPCQRHAGQQSGAADACTHCRVELRSACGAPTMAAGGHEFEANQLALVTASKQTIAPLDFKVRTTRAKGASPTRTQVQANRVDIHTLAWFAMHVPLARELRETLSKHALAGTLSDVNASWPGSAPSSRRCHLRRDSKAWQVPRSRLRRKRLRMPSTRSDCRDSKT